ncbi:glycosyl hydrolase family 65 protein [Ereboglobus luteus]|uniref:Family 65 glycosyl hydrolase n=1 Tax=Ereboglobus luteus TaxID=1796921 RepID=A0A2U8E5K7_9BACT|nr:glycosyl hydrolase family 65 protein [Ereboglobus luteus]AWI10218.1 family 65 glycosyl hydrolase [Ereboglobus luteus]
MNEYSSWIVETEGFDAGEVAKNGSKFMIGNGAVGVRGTLDEFSREQLVACTLSGLYDKVGDLWREPVNAPNPFFLRITCDGAPVSVLDSACTVLRHTQSVDMRGAVHARDTVFQTSAGIVLRVQSERWLSLDDTSLGASRIRITPDRPCKLTVELGIDGDTWDLNGPHLTHFQAHEEDEIDTLCALTHENAIPVVVAQAVQRDPHSPGVFSFNAENSIVRRFDIEAMAGHTCSFTKFAAFSFGQNARQDAVAACRRALAIGYDTMLGASRAIWDRRWANSDVQIDGDAVAQLGMRHSIYNLLIVAPQTDRASIPARGLSGQVYKGGIFWDTEIFMLPFFDHTQPALSGALVRYRIRTLDGARRKAAEYGCRGAFYAWESQDTGDDACTHFNVTDVFTQRPMRTYFRDKQIHVSADVALAIWRHYHMTGDAGVLLDGGAEVILECARFFISYAWYKPEKDRYEILDVVGPDEYHERVNNNAFTNVMVRATLRIALDAINALGEIDASFQAKLIKRLDYEDDLVRLRDMIDKLHMPAPDKVTGIIPQFDGYLKLEDIGVDELKKRILKQHEYWGGGHGLATTTQVIKQADVVLMLHLFGDEYADEVKRANWEYYESRCEHGSSLSACAHALVAAATGGGERAYDYFLRTATIDLTGESKQFLGAHYIGGTHPAANGGAWMVAVQGFAGLRIGREHIILNPSLPKKWSKLVFRFQWRCQWFSVCITPGQAIITADSANTAPVAFCVAGKCRALSPGEKLS